MAFCNKNIDSDEFDIFIKRKIIGQYIVYSRCSHRVMLLFYKMVMQCLFSIILLMSLYKIVIILNKILLIL